MKTFQLITKLSNRWTNWGKISINEDFLYAKESLLALLIYLLSYTPKSKISRLILDNDAYVIKVGTYGLSKLRNASNELFRLRKNIFKNNISMLDVLIQLFNQDDGIFFINPMVALSLLKKRITKLKIKRETKKELLKSIKKLTQEFHFLLNSARSKSSDLSNTDENLNMNNISDKVVDTYTVGPYKVEIKSYGDEEYLYYVYINSNRAIVRLFSTAATSIIDDLILDKEVKMNLQEILSSRRRLMELILSSVFPEIEVDYSERKVLCEYSAYKTLNFHKFMPFMLDEYVCEFYIDAPNTRIYIDHFKYGRCQTNVLVTRHEVWSFINNIKMETRYPLDEENNSLKVDLETEKFKARISIDIPPLAVDGPVIDVRKYRTQTFTLPELIYLKMLPIDVAALILLYARYRANIVIIGEPGSGKTTLLNAIDICLPLHFRRVYIEDVVESVKLHDLGFHQVRLRVEPYEVINKKSLKSSEIIKLLHRNPDYVILGELQTKEHFIAAFQAMVSGLRCIQTCHANSIQQFFHRLCEGYGISRSLILNTLNLIILVKRYITPKEFRRVIQVAEISPVYNKGYEVIYSYPSKEFKRDIFSTSTFFKYLKETDLINSFEREFYVYKKALEYMIEKRIFNVQDVVRLFSKVVYKMKPREEVIYA